MKYGVIQHLKYLFNYNRTVVHMQVELDRIPEMQTISAFQIREMDINNKDELLQWVEVVNDAYSIYQENHYTLETAQKHMYNHLMLNITNVFILMFRNEIIGTYSIGIYKNNNKIGGGARLAVKKKYHQLGLGALLILHGCHQLRENGIKYAENLWAIKRKPSIILGFKCGYVPQFNRKYIQYKKQRRNFLIRTLVNMRLRKLYKDYKKSVAKKFLVK